MILPCRVNIVQLKLDGRKVLGVLGYGGVHELSKPHSNADPHDAGFSLRGKTRRIFEPSGMINERLGIIEQRTAGICEIHTSLVTNE